MASYFLWCFLNHWSIFQKSFHKSYSKCPSGTMQWDSKLLTCSFQLSHHHGLSQWKHPSPCKCLNCFSTKGASADIWTQYWACKASTSNHCTIHGPQHIDGYFCALINCNVQKINRQKVHMHIIFLYSTVFKKN